MKVKRISDFTCCWSDRDEELEAVVQGSFWTPGTASKAMRTAASRAYINALLKNNAK